MRFLYSVLVAAVCVALATVPASAQISFNLNNAAQSVNDASAPLTFAIDFANGALPSNIDGFSVVFQNVNGAPALDSSPFFTYLTSINALTQPVPANFSATGVTMFTADATGVNPGLYTGEATIEYDTDGVDVIAVTQNFSVTVIGAEPCTLALLGLAGSLLTGSLLFGRRKRRLLSSKANSGC
jgi:hypothetical protein